MTPPSKLSLQQILELIEKAAADLRRQPSEPKKPTRMEVAKETEHARAEFLANIKDEIWTHLNGIIGMTELSLDRFPTREQKDNLVMIRSSANSLLAVINDIMGFSGNEARSMELQSREFSLRACIESITGPLGIRARENGLDLLVDIPSDVPDSLKGDPDRLRQVLLNIISNAIRFTEKGRVIVRAVQITNGENKAMLQFTVSDTGIGMSDDDLERVFGVFSQVERTPRLPRKNGALGLSVVSHLVSKMGGQIWGSSRLGLGSEFHFTVALETRKPSIESTDNLASNPDNTLLKGRRILILVNDISTRQVLKDILTSWQMKITFCENYFEALDIMKFASEMGMNFHCVLLDCDIPQMDGLAFAALALSETKVAQRIILLSRSPAWPDDAVRCRQLGIQACLAKPIRQEEIFLSIKLALGIVNSRNAVPGA